MVISVNTALELEQKPVTNEFILVEENNTSDASFIVSSFIENSLKKKQKIILLLFQNTIGHYHAIGQKLGYNLLEYQKQGNVIVHDFLKLVSDNISMNGTFTNEEFLKNYYCDIEKNINDIVTSSDAVLIIDNIGNLLSVGFELRNVLFFAHYLQSLLSNVKNLTVICLIHNIINNKFKMLVNYLRHISKLNIVVDDLKTGRAVDISGKLMIKWRTPDSIRWDEQNEYHYQLLDKNVNVFAPGMKYM